MRYLVMDKFLTGFAILGLAAGVATASTALAGDYSKTGAASAYESPAMEFPAVKADETAKGSLKEYDSPAFDFKPSAGTTRSGTATSDSDYDSPAYGS